MLTGGRCPVNALPVRQTGPVSTIRAFYPIVTQDKPGRQVRRECPPAIKGHRNSIDLPQDISPVPFLQSTVVGVVAAPLQLWGQRVDSTRLTILRTGTASS
jgi:hypothetical protein